MRRAILAVFFVLALVPGLGFGRGEERSWQNLSQLRSGQKIDVVDMNSRSLNGTFLGFSEEAISLRVDNGEVAVQRANVRRGRLRQPKRLRNIALGVAIGVGAGVAISVPFWMAEGTTVFQGMLGPLLGGGAGAATGAAVPLGSRTIYKAKKLRGGAPR